jgi:branched-subunit amino acid aminotransferase/4-amino-4-deoxychorismate lyase
LIGRNKLEASGMKMILTGGYSPSGYEPAGPNLIITQQPLPLPAPAQLRNGISIITHSYIREIPEAKTINYTIGIRLIRQIREKGADDVLYHQEGIVTEFPRSNFFIVKQDNTVVTPAGGVLAGITRKKVLQLAAQSYRAEAAPVRLEDILSASEAFMTSTTKRILPVVQVDGRMIGTGKPGPVTLALLEKLVRLEEESPE